MLSTLELLASEGPDLLPVVVGNLASSPARSVLLELATSFDVSGPAELAGGRSSMLVSMIAGDSHGLAILAATSS